MEETRNSCFGSKRGKHECRTITAVYCCYIAYVYVSVTSFFRSETIVASLLHLMRIFYEVIINHTSKHQFVVIIFFKLTYFQPFILKMYTAWFLCNSHSIQNIENVYICMKNNFVKFLKTN